ncbi:DNA-directed RNA polymerase, alpha subunit [Neorickettsia helminthoeca str. Oregon]|uniref:DNA-directed RNA polymerase subunit alpha n=1 Tax=Neorickettsia helminthoeca str. Oregon TaxID=1286528 RepID=X5H3U0_9RICK|nr:DNA-directed RNA polymerase subunit alpha [Neorickettsia helminthoeca]AHX11231.1 DNA-directed RNA polymerase, alpha subunit [Neorickettsia helminthoeca str. Oregon]
MNSTLEKSSSLDSIFSSPSVVVNQIRNGYSAEFIVEPLYTGFGLTIGNAMRRVLLSSLGSVAISAIGIKGLTHEFSCVPGVREDFSDLALNLKKVVLRSVSGVKEGCLYLSVSGAGPVLSGMISPSDDFEVVNTDLLLCNVAEGASLEMKIKVSWGFGYVSSVSVKRDEYDLEGFVPIDTTYNPVRAVNFAVKPTGVGGFVGYDRLILSVETNGAIDPKDAVLEASRVLATQAKCFLNIADPSLDSRAVARSSAELEANDTNDLLSAKVDRLYLSARSRKCLSNENIVYIRDLVSKTEADLLKAPNFGRRSLDEVKKELLSKGLSLGMNIDS